MRRRTSTRGSAPLRTLAALAALGGLAALLTALPRLGLPARDDARAPIEVWGWNIAGRSLEHLSPAFEAAHPTSDVVVKISGTAMQSRFLLAMASGRGAPDVMQLQEREAGKFTATGKLADFTAWAAKYERDFPASFWASCVEDGQVRAIPWDIAPCAVFYKRWVFERHGIDPDRIETWDDFIAAGRQLVERSGGRTKLMPLAPSGVGPLFQILMLQNGGGVFDAAGRIVLDDPRNAEALAVIRKLLDSGVCTPQTSAAELQVSYTNDSVAAYPGAAWMMQDMKGSAASRAGQWGVFRLPAIRPGGVRNSNQGGSVLVVPAQSANAADAAAFVEYALCTVDAQLVQFKEFGLFPGYLPAQRDPRFDVPDPFFGGQHVAKLFAEDFDELPPMIRTRDWNEAEQQINLGLFSWAIDRQDDRAFLKRTATLLGERLGREVAGDVGPAATVSR